MPREAAADMSPNGSMNTSWSASANRKADWPYHSICIGKLLGDAGRAAEPREPRGEQTTDDREQKRCVEPGLKRPRDQFREELAAGERGAVVERERAEHVRADELLDRVVAEERGKQDRDRREVGDSMRGGRW